MFIYIAHFIHKFKVLYIKGCEIDIKNKEYKKRITKTK